MKNKIQDLTRTDRAVSPVIGVILMVAITVILAAVIGTFVLDLGQSAGQSAPQASLSVSVDDSTNVTTIEHSGGDALSAEDTRVLIETDSGTGEFNSTSGLWSGTLSVGEDHDFDTSGNATFSPGEQVTVTIIDTNSQRQVFDTTVTA